MNRQVELLGTGRLPPHWRRVTREAFRGGYPKRVARLRIDVEDVPGENPGPFDGIFVSAAKPENRRTFHDPYVAIAAAPCAQILRRGGVQRFQAGARPAHDDALFGVRGNALREQLAGSGHRVIELGQEVRVAVDFAPLDRTAGRRAQLGQPVFAGDIQLVRGTRTHSQERSHFGILRGADFPPALVFGVELPQAVFQEHHHPPPHRHRGEHVASRGGWLPHGPFSVAVLFQRVQGSGPKDTPRCGVHPFGGWPVRLRVAARLGYGGGAVAVEQAHGTYCAVADVDPAIRHDADGTRVGFRQAVAHTPGAPQEPVIGMEPPRSGPEGQEREKHSGWYALVHGSEPPWAVPFRRNLRAAVPASRSIGY